MSFPDPRTYEFPEWILLEDYFYFARDVISFGDPLTIENLRDAYLKGVFPWNMEGVPLPWYCPDPRSVLIFDEVRVPKSLAKVIRQAKYRFTIDADFQGVIQACALAPRTGQKGTWITGEFIDRYTELHREGMAHSVEVWEGDKLVGGLYGVDAGGVFCGESMFHKVSNASKLALLFLVDHLRSRGATWLDVQVMTPHLKALGAREIRRFQFLQMLRSAQENDLKLFA